MKQTLHLDPGLSSRSLLELICLAAEEQDLFHKEFREYDSQGDEIQKEEVSYYLVKKSKSAEVLKEQGVEKDLSLSAFILLGVFLLMGFEVFYIKRRGDL